MLEKHLDHYVTEFAGRHNVREMDTIDQIAFLAVVIEVGSVSWATYGPNTEEKNIAKWIREHWSK